LSLKRKYDFAFIIYQTTERSNEGGINSFNKEALQKIATHY
jgi:hypothetical protein